MERASLNVFISTGFSFRSLGKKEGAAFAEA
jgi:hypothetical protein